MTLKCWIFFMWSPDASNKVMICFIFNVLFYLNSICSSEILRMNDIVVHFIDRTSNHTWSDGPKHFQLAH